jgi:acyl-CoA-binding protein
MFFPVLIRPAAPAKAAKLPEAAHAGKRMDAATIDAGDAIAGCVDPPGVACYQDALSRPRESRAMADLKEQFQQAAKDVMSLSERPDNDTMLRLYALYKQGSDGDVSGPRPGFFDFVGTAKYEAWEKLAGTSQEEAMRKYVDAVKKLVG